MESSLVSKHLVRRDLERDPDHINNKLWKRKLYKKRIERNEVKKVRKHFFKEKEEEQEPAAVDDKKQEFYKQLFSADEPKPLSRRQRKKLEASQANPSEEVKKAELSLPPSAVVIKEVEAPAVSVATEKPSFNKKYERIRAEKEKQAQLREERERNRLKTIKKKLKYAKKLN